MSYRSRRELLLIGGLIEASDGGLCAVDGEVVVVARDCNLAGKLGEYSQLVIGDAEQSVASLAVEHFGGKDSCRLGCLLR